MTETEKALRREIDRLRRVIRKLESNISYQVTAFNQIIEFDSYDEAAKEIKQYSSLPENIRPSSIRKVYIEEIEIK